MTEIASLSVNDMLTSDLTVTAWTLSRELDDVKMEDMLAVKDENV